MVSKTRIDENMETSPTYVLYATMVIKFYCALQYEALMPTTYQVYGMTVSDNDVII